MPRLSIGQNARIAAVVTAVAAAVVIVAGTGAFSARAHTTYNAGIYAQCLRLTGHTAADRRVCMQDARPPLAANWPIVAAAVPNMSKPGTVPRSPSGVVNDNEVLPALLHRFVANGHWLGHIDGVAVQYDVGAIQAPAGNITHSAVAAAIGQKDYVFPEPGNHQRLLYIVRAEGTTLILQTSSQPQLSTARVSGCRGQFSFNMRTDHYGTAPCPAS